MNDERFLSDSTRWTVSHVPNSATQATITKAAPSPDIGARVRNVVTSITVTLAANTTAPAAQQLVVNLIDGASGGTTYLWRSYITLPAVAGAQTTITLGNIWIPAAIHGAVTLEFSAAGGTNTFESVSMQGVTGT